MCKTCWESYNSPKIYNLKVEEAVKCIARVYDEVSTVGGDLHVILDDWNLEDEHLDSCLKDAKENASGYDKKQVHIQLNCIAVLKSLTLEERASALAVYEGFT